MFLSLFFSFYLFTKVIFIYFILLIFYNQQTTIINYIFKFKLRDYNSLLIYIIRKAYYIILRIINKKLTDIFKQITDNQVIKKKQTGC